MNNCLFLVRFDTVRDNKTGSAARFGGSPGPVLVFHTEVGTVASTRESKKHAEKLAILDA